MSGPLENRRGFRQQCHCHLLLLVDERAQIGVFELSGLCLANPLAQGQQPLERLRILPVELIHRPRRRGR
jgi:hypothetical protein